MKITAPPTIPLITDPNTFATRSQDWVVWQTNELYPALQEASVTLTLSLTATSATSNTISGTADKTFTVETNKGFVAGQYISIASTTSPTNRILAVVKSYNSTTGVLVATPKATEGSGTFSAWSISIAFSGATLGKNKFTDAQDFANAVYVATASTVNLNAMPANAGILDGTTPITAFTLSDGAFRRLRCPAGIPLIFNSITNYLNTGGTNYTTQLGDELHITAFGSTIIVQIIPASGLPVISPPIPVVNGALIGFRVFTSTSTYTKSTNNPSFVIVEAVGGGGGGGGSASTGEAGGGGGGGGYAIKKIAAASLSDSVTVTVGAAGAGSPTNSTSGSSGGTSSFGTHLSATGGGGGQAHFQGRAGGGGGSGVSGDLNISGVAGGSGLLNTAAGVGGTSKLGGQLTSSGAGGVGRYGGGGGFAGYTGVVIVWEYS